jgi:SNF2 family DNA or RNA helicase
MCGSMIFSGWNDSFESWYQAIGRAVRYGQKKSVRIHLPFIRELEYEQLENIFRKQGQFEAAILEQEKAYIKAMKGMKLL